MTSKENCPECGHYQEFGFVHKTPNGVRHLSRCSIWRAYEKTLPPPVIDKEAARKGKERARLDKEDSKNITQALRKYLGLGEDRCPAKCGSDDPLCPCTQLKEQGR